MNTNIRKSMRAALRTIGVVVAAAAMLAFAPASLADAQPSCFTAVWPRGHATQCFAYPTTDPDFEMTPRYAAQYCDRWVGTGTALPCPYAQTAAEASGAAAPPADEDEERGNRWRRFRN